MYLYIQRKQCMKKIGILTSGGDAPGMNAAIRSITKAAFHYNMKPIGIDHGYEGLIEGHFHMMKYSDVDNIIQTSGTILGTARSEEFMFSDGRKKALQQLQKEKIDGLIVIGGNGTLTGAEIFSNETNFPIIGLPATIDNDLYGTEATIGYDTALNTIVKAIDNIRDTATSNQRIFFVEVMGRDSGFLALNSAIASGAESVLIPETITDLEALARQIKTQNKGRRSSIIIVAEGEEEGGAMDIKRKIKPYLPDFKLRTTILGHVQRGGSPSYFDRALATRSGVYAVELLQKGITKTMVGINNDELITLSFKEATSTQSKINLRKEKIMSKLLTH